MKWLVGLIVVAMIGFILFSVLKPYEKPSSASQAAHFFGEGGWWVRTGNGEIQGVAVARIYKEFSREPFMAGHAWIVASDQPSGEQIGRALKSATSAHPLAAVLVGLIDQAAFRDHDPIIADQQIGDARLGFCSWSCPVSNMKIAIMAILPASANFRSELGEMAGGCHTYTLGYKDLTILPPPVRVFTPLSTYHRKLGEGQRPPGFDDWNFRALAEGKWLEWRDGDAAHTNGSNANETPSPAVANGHESGLPQNIAPEGHTGSYHFVLRVNRETHYCLLRVGGTQTLFRIDPPDPPLQPGTVLTFDATVPSDRQIFELDYGTSEHPDMVKLFINGHEVQNVQPTSTIIDANCGWTVQRENDDLRQYQ